MRQRAIRARRRTAAQAGRGHSLDLAAARGWELALRLASLLVQRRILLADVGPGPLPLPRRLRLAISLLELMHATFGFRGNIGCDQHNNPCASRTTTAECSFDRRLRRLDVGPQRPLPLPRRPRRVPPAGRVSSTRASGWTVSSTLSSSTTANGRLRQQGVGAPRARVDGGAEVRRRASGGASSRAIVEVCATFAATTPSALVCVECHPLAHTAEALRRGWARVSEHSAWKAPARSASLSTRASPRARAKGSSAGPSGRRARRCARHPPQGSARRRRPPCGARLCPWSPRTGCRALLQCPIVPLGSQVRKWGDAR